MSTNAWEQEEDTWKQEEGKDEDGIQLVDATTPAQDINDSRADGELQAAAVDTQPGDSVNPDNSPATTIKGVTFKVKASLVLLESDIHDYGVIEDTLNNLMWQPGLGEVVGTWSRPRYDNRIHINLCTALSALEDRSIQTFKFYTEQNALIAKGVVLPKKPRSTKTAKESPTSASSDNVVETVSVDTKIEFNSLRAKLMKKK